MVTGKKKIIAAAIVGALAGGMGVSAAAPYTLQGVTVTGDRVTYGASVSREEQAKWLPGGYERAETRLGIAGDQDVMKTPYVVHSFTTKAMEQMVPANGNIDQILANVPSIKIGTTPIKTDFSVRGIFADAGSFYMNGVPGMFIMAQGPMTNIIDRTDVLVGPAATLNGSLVGNGGFGPTGGQPAAIYLHTKRPDVNLNRIGISTGGYGDFGTTFDISRKDLGANGEWGVRVYGMYDDGGMAISGASQRRKNIFMDLEHKGRKSDTNLFVGSFDDRLWGTERRFTIDRNFTKLPSAPDPTKSYDDPHFMHRFNYGNELTLNHEQKINDTFDWFFNGGISKSTTRRFIYQGTINIDQQGNFVNERAWSDYINMDNRYAQIGFNAHFNTGVVHHDFTAALDRSYRKFYKVHTMRKPNAITVDGNMYSGPIFHDDLYYFHGLPRDVTKHLTRHATGKLNGMATGSNNFSEMDTGLNLMDRMKYKKWNFMAGANRRHGNYDGGGNDKVVDDHWVPVYAVTYSPNDDLSVYAAYTKETTKSERVTDTDADNYGALIGATEMSQKELGVKYKFHNMVASLTYFDMKVPQLVDRPTDRASGSYEEALNGNERYKGIDFNITGHIARKWNMFGGFEYLHARQEDTVDGKNGMPVDQAAKWNTVLGLEYQPNEDWSIMGRMNYTGHGVITGDENPRHRLQVPSYTTFDFFVNYKTKWGKTPVKLSAAVYNAFQHDHWVLQPGQGAKLMLNMPRTYVISATFDF